MGFGGHASGPIPPVITRWGQCQLTLQSSAQDVDGEPGGARTCDHSLRRRVLCPELRCHVEASGQLHESRRISMIGPSCFPSRAMYHWTDIAFLPSLADRVSILTDALFARRLHG